MRRDVLAMVAIAVACSSGEARAQGERPAPPDRAAVVKAAAAIMEAARYCTLVTVGEDGHPQARIIDAFPPEDGLVVWMATNAATRKVAQIQKEPRVTLSYFDPKTMRYVTLLGRATLVADAGEKTKRWKEAWAALYKDRNRGDDYLLIKVVPTRVEVSAEDLGIRHDPRTWRPTIVDFR